MIERIPPWPSLSYVRYVLLNMKTLYDRRFHAEPVACPDCGPSLTFHEKTTSINDNQTALLNTVTALKQGKVVAVKGIGGYHLMCDAANNEAVARLRKNKPRPDKPLAVMFPAPIENPFKFAEDSVTLSDRDKTFLLQPARPILLVKKNTETKLSERLAPALNEVGMMLPYSPLHHLLLNEFGGPLVATSANISGEPVLTDNHEVEKRLAHVADAYLHHNRAIERPADDPVYRTIAGKAQADTNRSRFCTDRTDSAIRAGAANTRRGRADEKCYHPGMGKPRRYFAAYR